MADDESEETEEGGQGGGIDPRVVRSYLAFAKRAIQTRKLTIIAIAAVGFVLTVVVAKYLPRTYSCSTVMMTVQNAVLDSDRGPKPLAGAKSLIMRHENLELLVKQTNLIKKFRERRPPLMALKDRAMEALTGKLNDKVMTAILVGTMENKISIDTEDDNLSIDVDWSDGNTAAELAQAVQDGFLRIRHKSEISAFQEKMAILDSHAGKLREEIEALAVQLNSATSAQLERASKDASPGAVRTTTAGRISGGRPKPAVDSELPELRERLAALKAKLGAAESERAGRMSVEQGKLDELKLKLTPSHPQVMTQEERLAMASQVSSELAMMRSEVGDLESQIRQRDAMAKTGQAVPSSVTASAAGGEDAQPLSAGVAMVLSSDDGDPALRAQLSGAVVRYGSLRDEVRASKLALDTAQAAFNHRYQIVIPVEVPSKPTKPNMMAVLMAGFVLSLLIAFIVPIISELRRGVLLDYWQVDAFKLPVLAELHLPPAAKD